MTLNEIMLYMVYFYLLINVKRILHWIYNILLRPRRDLLSIYGKGSWVLVTGASDGIGKAFCEELARTGFNIVLVARNKEKLQKVEDSLKNLNPEISTKIVVFDFSKKTSLLDYKQNFYDFLKDIKDIDISFLINNVGTGYPNKFNDLTIEEIEDIIHVNINSQTFLTKLFLPILKSRKQKSAIINVSSYGGQFPLPYYSLYSASKVYSDFLSRGIGEEEKQNVDFLSAKPFEVATVLSGHSSFDGFFVISPAACVKGCLDALGYDSWTAGGWAHQIQVGICNFAFSIAPEWLAFWIQSSINKSLIELHKSNKLKEKTS